MRLGALFPGVFWFAMAVCGSLCAESVRDGGREVSVALFSTGRLASVTLTPLSSHAWTARCSGCDRTPLTGPIRFEGRRELFAGGALRVSDDDSHKERSATGLWHLRSRGDGIDVVLTLPSERYVEAVLNAEAAVDEPAESLRALAIVARTYALNGAHFSAAAGHLAAESCDSTECQAMRLGPSSPAVEDAVWATAGETLWFRGRPAEVFFSENCGGGTEDAGAVWPRLRGLPYLASHADPYCLRRGAAAWHGEVSLAELRSIAAAQGWHLPERIVAARVVARSGSRRALRVEFFEDASHSAVVDAGALRIGIGRALGWNRIRSDGYELALRGGVLVFDGRGYGHGVGLCQAGAAEMAMEGKSARQILDFYFSGTAVGIGPEDRGWVASRLQSVAVRSTQEFSAGQKSEFEELWRTAVGRFPSRKSIVPEVTFAPSTELFRQLASEPGWTLASTRGSRIVLQPLAVLRRGGDDPQKALLHEMLHVLVEAEATERAPLWLREGLVEELAGEAGFPTAGISGEAIDAALLRADSLGASGRAHRAAGWRVHLLVGRYGISVVRGWLVSGVPESVEAGVE